MGSFRWLSPGSAMGGLTPRLRLLRSTLLDMRPVVRWAFAGSALGLILLLVYLGAVAPAASQTVYLHAGRRFTPDDLAKIARALDKQRIVYHIDDERRMAVAASKRDQAEEVISRLDIGPRPPGELRDQASAASPWESPRDKEVREQQERARIIQAMINDLPGVLGSFVSINRPRPRMGLQPTNKPTAFVRIETDGDRQLPFRTIQSITTILTGFEDGLTVDSITVVDRRGHKYLVAGNPELSALSSNRAREEELSQEILNQLDWIKGVRVSVQLPSGSENSGSGTGPRAKEVESPPLPSPAAVHRAAPVLALNRSMSLDPEPEPSEAAPSHPKDSATSPPVTGTGLADTARTPIEPGHVWVRVPRSYYYQVSLVPGHKDPTREDLMKLAARTEEQIRTGIGLIVPLSGASAWKATVDIIQDELPPSDPGSVTEIQGRRPALDWGIAGVMGALAASLVALGSWAVHALRTSVRSESFSRGLRYEAGTRGAPGPSERVREFVRRNPEAAVSVLERWTRQGGSQP